MMWWMLGAWVCQSVYMILKPNKERCLHYPMHEPRKQFIVNVYLPKAISPQFVTLTTRDGDAITSQQSILNEYLNTFEDPSPRKKSVCLISTFERPVVIFFAFQAHRNSVSEVRQGWSEVPQLEAGVLPELFQELEEMVLHSQTGLSIIKDKSTLQYLFEKQEHRVTTMIVGGMLLEVLVLALLSFVQYSKLKSILSAKCLI